MVDALDLELIEKTQPAYLKDLLQSIDLINMPIRVDRNSITGKKSVLSISFHGKLYHDLDGKSTVKTGNQRGFDN